MPSKKKNRGALASSSFKETGPASPKETVAVPSTPPPEAKSPVAKPPCVEGSKNSAVPTHSKDTASALEQPCTVAAIASPSPASSSPKSEANGTRADVRPSKESANGADHSLTGTKPTVGLSAKAASSTLQTTAVTKQSETAAILDMPTVRCTEDATATAVTAKLSAMSIASKVVEDASPNECKAQTIATDSLMKTEQPLNGSSQSNPTPAPNDSPTPVVAVETPVIPVVEMLSATPVTPVVDMLSATPVIPVVEKVSVAVCTDAEPPAPALPKVQAPKRVEALVRAVEKADKEIQAETEAPAPRADADEAMRGGERRTASGGDSSWTLGREGADADSYVEEQQKRIRAMWEAKLAREEKERLWRDATYYAEMTAKTPSWATDQSLNGRLAEYHAVVVAIANDRRFSPSKQQEFVELLASSDEGRALDAVEKLREDLRYLQLAEDAESVRCIEHLLVAALGSPFGQIRELSVRVLNSVYDGTDWQLEEPFEVVVRAVLDPFDMVLPLDRSEVPAPFQRLFVLVNGPSFDHETPEYIITRHRFSQDPHDDQLKVCLNPFSRAGFYDWLVVLLDDDGGFSPLSVPGVEASKLRGRFIVHPGIQNEIFHEVVVDMQDARWDNDSGQVISIGTFANVKNALPAYKADGVTCLYLMGVLERDNGAPAPPDGSVPRPSCSPMAVIGRDLPCSMLGGSSGLKEVMEAAHAHGIKVMVDALPWVGAARYNRRYQGLEVHMLDSRGCRVAVAAGDGKDMTWEATMMLNYRKLAVWDLMLNDILNMARWYGVQGVRIECAQSTPSILEPDWEELTRPNLPDGPPGTPAAYYYSAIERLEGHVVLPNSEVGYWATAAAEQGYANPLLVKLAKGIWREFPDFIISGAADMDRERDRNVALSGVIPHVTRLAAILAPVFGKKVSGHMAVVEVAKKDKAESQAVQELCSMLGRDGSGLPEGSMCIGSITSHFLPYPAVLYGPGTWAAVDLLFFLPDVPMTLIGEDDGRTSRPNITGVYKHSRHIEAAVQPVAKQPPPTALPAVILTRHTSYRRQKGPATPPVDYITAHHLPGPVSKLSSLSMGRSISVTDMQSYAKHHMVARTPPTPVDLHQFALQRDEQRKEVEIKFDRSLDAIKLHYGARRQIRKAFPVLQFGKIGVLSARHRYGVHERVFVFSRYLTVEETGTGDPEIVVVATNLNDAESIFTIDLSALADFVPQEEEEHSESYVYEWADLFAQDEELYTGDAAGEAKNVFTRHEVLYSYNFTTLPPYGMLFWRLVRRPRTPDLYDRLLRNSWRRLKQSLDANMEDRANYLYNMVASAVRSKSIKRFAHIMDLFGSKFLRVGQIRIQAMDFPGPNGQIKKRLNASNGDIIPITDTLLALITHLIHEARKGGDNDIDARALGYLLGLARLDPDDENEYDEEVVSKYSLCRWIWDRNHLGPLVFIAPELGKWSTVGGLGVMVDELTVMLAAMGAEVLVISPYYDKNRKGETGYLIRDGIKWSRNIHVAVGSETILVGVHEGTVRGVRYMFLHNCTFFPSPYNGGDALYQTQQLVLVGKGSLEALCAFGIVPGIVVTNDWFGGMVAAYAKRGFFGDIFKNTLFFHIVHNLDPSYEGRLYPNEGDLTQVHHLPRDYLIDPYWEKVCINPSRCALICSDQWGTVSPSYRSELLAGSSLSALLNKFPEPFATPNGIPVDERLETLTEKAGSSHDEAKGLLQTKYFKFHEPDLNIPLFSFVGRICEQKGVDLVVACVRDLIRVYNGRIQILCGGMANLTKYGDYIVDTYSYGVAQEMFKLRAEFPWSFYANPAEFFTDGPLVNLGSDFGVMPSRFEPGGIVQQEFFVAGTPVIAFKTGGLKDTVHEFDPVAATGNGFVFEHHNAQALMNSFQRAMAVYADPNMYGKLRQNARESVVDAQEVGWKWYTEFARLKGCVIAHKDRMQHELKRVEPELAAMKPVYRPPRVQPTPAAVFRWTHGANEVYVAGSWDGWSGRLRLSRGLGNKAHEWQLSLHVSPGTYAYKFIVDDVWVNAMDQPMANDEGGNMNNTITVHPPRIPQRAKRPPFRSPF